MVWEPEHHPDADLPRETISLREFNLLVEDIWFNEHNVVERQDFETCLAALAGRYHHSASDEEHRLFINARNSAQMPPPAQDEEERNSEDYFHVIRDFDSILGTSEDLPYQCSLNVYPVAPFSETLTHRVYLYWPITRGNQRTEVEISRIPNLCLAKVGLRSKVNVMFPAMYTPHMSPPSLRVQGQLHFGTAEIPAHDIPTFYRRLRRYMNRIPQFQGAFFYHEVRGAKGGTHHDPEDDDDAEFALQDVFGHLDFDQITDDDLNHRWFVDVALEVRRPGHVVHWRRDNMERIIRHAVPHGSPLTISHLPRGKVLKMITPCS
ncbi:uncharacterized protein B0H18DRAFT_1128572 [Fomitopsis serialis]|uniref:uncharacterized protein n=1 Tax=Fomitopsis serialis TaxID=139415 RepID=UPI0020084988|nr:uncharacterized protein B0H18DRAFT_1128572 [Neoantrodia serialis]KAH9911527.1 hypothetical protein B0H18DRAFT_1128572 [Neoantrodia serialis]